MSSETSTTTDTQDGAFVPALGKYFPESLVTALFLAVLALIVTIPYLDPITQVEMFGTGFFQLFTTQMLLILFWVLGATVVESARFGKILDWLAVVLPTSQRGIIYTTAFLSLLLAWVNWAFGLIGGILIGQRLCAHARENGTAVHYPLVLMGGLLALVIMNQGLSSPGALIMADETGLANFMMDDAGTIEMAEFIIHPVNIISSALLIVTLPLLLVALAPSNESDIEPLDDANSVLTGSISETLDHYVPGRPPGEWEVGDRLENSQTITMIAVVIGLASVIWHFTGGGDLTLPWLAFTLVVIGLLVQGPPMAFREKTENATKWANHIAIPFLLYAAVYALFQESGLYGTIGEQLGGIGVPSVVTYVIAFVVGLFVPDPGSVWVIVGPALTGFDLVPTIVSVMYGAGVSNLWLAFLFASVFSLYGFDWREFMKYAAIVTVYVTFIVLGLFLVL